MTTLILIAWFVIIFLYFAGLVRLSDSFGKTDQYTFISQQKSISILWMVIHGVIGIPLSVAVYNDIYGRIPRTDKDPQWFVILTGIELLLTSVSFLVAHTRAKSRENLNNPHQTTDETQDRTNQIAGKINNDIFRRPIAVLVAVVGFLASLAAIGSFLIDFSKR